LLQTFNKHKSLGKTQFPR